MIALLVAESKHNLLQEGQRLVDELSFLEHLTIGTCLLGPLATSQVDQVELGENDFVRGLNS